jgi:hypothetical protein
MPIQVLNPRAYLFGLADGDTCPCTSCVVGLSFGTAQLNVYYYVYIPYTIRTSVNCEAVLACCCKVRRDAWDESRARASSAGVKA